MIKLENIKIKGLKFEVEELEYSWEGDKTPPILEIILSQIKEQLEQLNKLKENSK